MRRSLLVLSIFAALLAAAWRGAESAASGPERPPLCFASHDQLYVHLDAADFAARAAELGARYTVESVGVYSRFLRVRMPPGREAALKASLRAEPGVVSVTRLPAVCVE